MNDVQNEVREGIIEVVSRVFGLSREVVEPGVSPDCVDGWDSEKHVELVVALEERFDCMFEPEEVAELTSIEQMQSIVAGHLNSRPR